MNWLVIFIVSIFFCGSITILSAGNVFIKEFLNDVISLIGPNEASDNNAANIFVLQHANVIITNKTKTRLTIVQSSNKINHRRMHSHIHTKSIFMEFKPNPSTSERSMEYQQRKKKTPKSRAWWLMIFHINWKKLINSLRTVGDSDKET